MNPSSSLHCSGCGGDLGLEPIGVEGPLRCPRCVGATLTVFDTAIHDCAECGGQFVGQSALHTLLATPRRLGASGVVRSSSIAPGGLDPVRYLPCPECSALMNRKNFGQTSGIVVDVCKNHGVWFDTGELPRVMSFVADGGLERERQRTAERSETSKATAHAVASLHPDAPLEGQVLSAAELLTELISLLR